MLRQIVVNPSENGMFRPLRASTSINCATCILNTHPWYEQGGAFKISGVMYEYD